MAKPSDKFTINFLFFFGNTSVRIPKIIAVFAKWQIPSKTKNFINSNSLYQKKYRANSKLIIIIPNTINTFFN